MNLMYINYLFLNEINFIFFLTDNKTFLKEKNNLIVQEQIKQKIEQRSDKANIIYRNIIESNNNDKKEILQNNRLEIPFENRLTKDFFKEKAIIKSKNLEQIKNKINIISNERKEVTDYYEMNNKILNKTKEAKIQINSKPVNDKISNEVNKPSIGILLKNKNSNFENQTNEKSFKKLNVRSKSQIY